jgi:glyoxylase-like metal-dependent hydrolase (beta-lactamase superfamily II)
MRAIYTFTVGQMGVNCYVLVDTVSRKAIIIDPGDEAAYLAEKIESLKVKLVAILATHGHFDHVLGACELQLIYQVPFGMCGEDQFLLDRMRETRSTFWVIRLSGCPKTTQSLGDKQVIQFGKSHDCCIYTRTYPGSVSFYLKKIADCL